MADELVRKYLYDIHEAAASIFSYLGEKRDYNAYVSNKMLRRAVEREFEIIGEASHNIEIHFPDFAQAHPELPLAFAYQMRNSVAHGYFKVDFEIVWKTLSNDLAGLYSQVKTVLSDLPHKSNVEQD